MSQYNSFQPQQFQGQPQPQGSQFGQPQAQPQQFGSQFGQQQPQQFSSFREPQQGPWTQVPAVPPRTTNVVTPDHAAFNAEAAALHNMAIVAEECRQSEERAIRRCEKYRNRDENKYHRAQADLEKTRKANFQAQLDANENYFRAQERSIRLQVRPYIKQMFGGQHSAFERKAVEQMLAYQVMHPLIQPGQEQAGFDQGVAPQQFQQEAPSSWIVVFKDGANVAGAADAVTRDGGQITNAYFQSPQPVLNGFSVLLTPQQKANLEFNLKDDLKYVEPDGEVRAL